MEIKKSNHTPKFYLEKVANMIFLVTHNDVIFKSWDVDEFTERKYNNAIKKIQACYVDTICVERKF